jgi:2'-5' RNA ligase
MTESNVYYLWLMPEAKSNGVFSEVIRKLSHKYQTRLFDPHITLAGGITGPEDELLTKTEKLAAHLYRLKLEPLEIRYLEDFYRSLFLAVTPSDPLVNANKLAKQLFGLPLDGEFMPHLSLLYGDFSVSEKERIKAGLSTNLLKQFNVDRIVLIRTDTHSDQWTAVSSFPLI